MSSGEDRRELEEHWKLIYQKKLPSLAKQQDPAQKVWPVKLDHCFARIILDAVVGRGEGDAQSQSFSTAQARRITFAPWTARLKSPAIKNIDSSALANCIAMGEAIASGDINLVHLDEESLKYRGKSSKTNRNTQKRKTSVATHEPGTTNKKPRTTRKDEDIRKAFGASVLSPAAPASVDAKLSESIQHSDLTEFRKRVLLALCQVPEGSVSSYLALSKFLNSSPRAVGNALRNNPFAPQAPCHRIIAADNSIGGFGGSWGTEGAHFREKVDLLKLEGVRIDKDGKVKDDLWDGFQ